MIPPNQIGGHCPRCGIPLGSDAPEGLCPRCLAALPLGADTVLDGDDHQAATPPLSPEELGPHFPQLEIVSCLGRGGMGVVYKARQKSLNRAVALKLLAPERAGDAGFAERFAQEARALAAMNHPHIVGVYDFGQAGGFFYLLMEFVDGVNLRQAMQAGRFTPEQALAIVPPVCEALQYAHEHGIVHRDIKPENLLLDREGRVKIADFGVAKMLRESDPVTAPESTSGTLAAHSIAAGTPQYMAPEQKEHRVTDHRADIYSLGVVLYEMLTGELPAEKLQPPSRRVQVDIRIDEIVLRALENKPELRFQTAADFRTRVETVNAGKAVAQTAAPTTMPGIRFRLVETRDGRRVILWRNVWVATLAVFALVLIVGAASSLVAKGAAPLLVVVALAGIAAFLTVITSVRISFKPDASPQSEPDDTTGPARVSRAAIVGACWAPVPFFSFVAVGLASYQGRGAPPAGPEWWQLAILIPALIIGVAAPFGTTILGWLAVAQIRRSAGRIRGLKLAVFDGLVFPLMTLSAVIALAGGAMANWLSLNKQVAVIVGVVAVIVVNVLIVRAVLRAVRREAVLAPPESSATGHEIKAASIAIIFAGIATALGALAAIRNGGAWPAMALSLLFAGMSIITALPVRRLAVGKCALIIAALGTVIWPLLTAAISHSRGLPGAYAQAPLHDPPFFAAHLISQPESTRQPMAEPYGFPNSGDFLPWLAVFAITVLGGIVLLVVLTRKGVAADKIVLWVFGTVSLLFGLSAFVLIGWWASASRHGGVNQVEAGTSAMTAQERSSIENAPALADFGPVIERVITHPGEGTKNHFLDLDSGDFVQAPEDVLATLKNPYDEVTRSGRPNDPVRNWAQANGADLTIATTSPEIMAALYGGVIIYPTLDAKADPRKVLEIATNATPQRQANSASMPPLTLFGPRGGEDAELLFRTREGGIGLLEIVGLTENPRSVKIRYKLLKHESGTANLNEEGSADAQRYRLAPFAPQVRQTVDAILRRHQGMTKAQLQRSPELNWLMDRFIAALGASDTQMKIEQRIAAIKPVKGAEHGTLTMDFDLLDDARGRAWLGAVVSNDKQRMEDWALNTLDRAVFEFASDPSLDRTSDGVSITPGRSTQPPAADDKAKD